MDHFQGNFQHGSSMNFSLNETFSWIYFQRISLIKMMDLSSSPTPCKAKNMQVPWLVQLTHLHTKPCQNLQNIKFHHYICTTYLNTNCISNFRSVKPSQVARPHSHYMVVNHPGALTRFKPWTSGFASTLYIVCIIYSIFIVYSISAIL